MKFFCAPKMRLFAFSALLAGTASIALHAETVADFDTDYGRFTVRFFPGDAPKTVAQFEHLAGKGWYNGRVFYRVVKDFVLQSGTGNSNDPTTQNRKLPDEFNAHPHIKGTLSMAHGVEPNSGSTEFFVSLAEMPGMNGKYTVFAQVVSGMDVLDAIANTPVTEKWLDDKHLVPFHKPVKPVHIKKITLREAEIPTNPQP